MGLINALSLIDTKESIASITRFVQRTKQTHLARGLGVPLLSSRHTPTPELLLAIYGRLLQANVPPASDDVVTAAVDALLPDNLTVPLLDQPFDSEALVAMRHDSLLLAAGSLTFLATRNETVSEPTARAAALITSALGNLLAHALRHDATWDGIHHESKAHAADQWESMHHHAVPCPAPTRVCRSSDALPSLLLGEGCLLTCRGFELRMAQRDGATRHHSQMKRRALQWEVDKGHHTHHVPPRALEPGSLPPLRRL